ncbi:MAG: ParB/RepB/Spo0J family partition protein [Rhizobacter sp.]|nr:ParB/RepB/Spo0J family partition protein [Chlorobiales bacterium]
MAKLALGKGLKALLPDESSDYVHKQSKANGSRGYEFRDVQAGDIGTIGNIPIARITPNPFQPREDFNREALEELKKSIVEKGVIQPITVRKKGSGYELISGERRLRATTEAGFKEIPAYVLDVKTDREMLELALIENIQRERLNPVEIALGYQRLITECKLTQEEVADKVSKDRTTVTNFLRLLKLPQQIQESLRQGEISMGHARALINLEATKDQTAIWSQIVENRLSVRQVETMVQKAAKKQAKAAKHKPLVAKEGEPKSVDVLQIENWLRDKLATKIKLTHTKKGNGQITIDYYSVDDLERILDALSNPH